MKLFNNEDMFISKDKWRQVCLTISLVTLGLYVLAMICSLSGSSYFILNYQNTSMDNIQAFLQEHKIYSLIAWAFSTLEFCIITIFCIKKNIKWYYVISYYGIRVIIAFLVKLPQIFTSLYTIFFFLIIFILDQLISDKEISLKLFGKRVLRLIIAEAISLILQIMIYTIKAGHFTMQNQIMNLSSHFIYAIEFDIALSVLLITVALYIDKGKGDSDQWTIYHSHSGFSQTSKTRLQKLSPKNLTKRQKTKLFFLWVRLYVIQVIGFTFLMVIPFIMGKVFEFLVMYLTFALIRYILGFKYSLHFKNEFLCLSVGAIIFGILTLAVPFFYVEIIIAVLLGGSLATFLHLFYKYRGFWLFTKMAKPDKFAILYVIFEGNLNESYILRTCKYARLTDEDTKIVLDYMLGNKLSYIAYKYNYSVKTIDRKLSEIIEVLNR